MIELKYAFCFQILIREEIHVQVARTRKLTFPRDIAQPACFPKQVQYTKIASLKNLQVCQTMTNTSSTAINIVAKSILT